MNDFLQNLRNTQSEDQRPQGKVKKNFEKSYHHNSNPRFHSPGSFTRTPQHAKRPSPAQKPAGKTSAQTSLSETALLADTIENLASHIEILVKTQEKISSAFDRQTQVFEKMVSLFEEYVSGREEQDGAVSAESHKKKESRQESSHTESSEDDVNFERPDSSLFANKRRSVVRKRVRNESVSRQEAADGKKGEKKRPGLMSRKEIMGIIYSMRDQGATFEQVAKYLADLGQPTFSGRGEWHAQTVHRLCHKDAVQGRVSK